MDLSTFGLERVRLDETIELDGAETQLDPQNPNPRGVPATENERYYEGWEAAPEEQRVKLVTLARHVREHPDYIRQVVDNPDPQNSDLALIRLIGQAIRHQRRQELGLHKKYFQDEGFRPAFHDIIRRVLQL